MRELEDQLARGIYMPEKRIPLFQDVAEQWIKYKRVNLRESSWAVYKGHTKNHFGDLDSIRINRISTAKVEEFIPMNYSNAVNRYFRPALEKAKLPTMQWHDLRHTFASLLIHQGENIKYIQSQLGHSSPTVTLNVYAHLMNPVNQESACRLENTIFSVTGSKMVAGS